ALGTAFAVCLPRRNQGNRKQAEIGLRPLPKQLDTQQYAADRKDRDRKIGHHHWPMLRVSNITNPTGLADSDRHTAGAAQPKPTCNWTRSRPLGDGCRALSAVPSAQ